MIGEKQPNELSILIRVPSEIEAASIVAELESFEIAVTMTGGFTAGFIAEAPGDVQIKVFEKDRARAEKILQAYQAANETIDWSKIDVGRPEDD